MYERKVLPDGTIQTQAKAVATTNPLENIDTLAKAVFNAKLKHDRAKEDLFESELKIKQTEFNNKLKTLSSDEFGQAINEYNVSVELLGKEKLGENGYKKWWNEKGKNYTKLTQLGYDQIKLDKLQQEEFDDLKQTAKNEIDLAVMQGKSVNGELYAEINASHLTPEKKTVLKNFVDEQYSQASVIQDIRNNPEQAMKQLEAIDKKKNEPAFYKGLSQMQRQSYIDKAKKQYEAEKNTYNDKKINPLKQQFNILFEQGYDKAYEYLQEIDKHKNEIIGEKTGITQEQFQAFKSYAKEALKDMSNEKVIANQQAYGDLQVEFNKFNIKKNKKGILEINNKDLNNVESIVEMINNIDTGINDGTFYLHQQDVINKRTQLQEALGNMMDKKIKLKNWNIFSDTTSEYISASIQKIVLTDGNSEYKINSLSPQQKGQIYEHIYKTALNAGIDFKSTDTSEKQKIDRITQAYFDWYVKNLFVAPDKKYNAVVGNNSVYNLNEQNADKNIGIQKNGYGKYVTDKDGTKKLIDDDGNIVDEVR